MPSSHKIKSAAGSRTGQGEEMCAILNGPATAECNDETKAVDEMKWSDELSATLGKAFCIPRQS
jgi:hypothetical protein